MAHQNSQDMSFARALNEAKGVIIQLSGRVKTDADKIRTQQQTIVSQSASIAQAEERIRQQEEALAAAVDEVAGLHKRVEEADTAREHSEAILNRQGEKIQALVAANEDLETMISEMKLLVADLTRERDELRAALPTADDAAALAEMTQLLSKAAPAIEKTKKLTGGAPKLRLASANDGAAMVAEAA